MPLQIHTTLGLIVYCAGMLSGETSLAAMAAGFETAEHPATNALSCLDVGARDGGPPFKLTTAALLLRHAPLPLAPSSQRV